MSDSPVTTPNIAVPLTTPAPRGVSPLRALTRVALGMSISVLALLVIYLAVSVPAQWFPSADTQSFAAKDLALARGAGQLVDDELRITAADKAGIVLISVVPNLRAADYPAIAWIVADAPDAAPIRMLWRNDLAPDKLHTLEVPVEAGKTQPVIVTGNPAWVGNITGLALAIQGPVTQPIRVWGVSAKPMGALETLTDRVRDWLAFEGWVGTSINTISGGADAQVLPLPVLLALAIALCALAIPIIERRRPGTFGASMPVALAMLFLLAWLVLDARWTSNLFRQEIQTAQKYAGKDMRGKLFANDDAQLYAFVERALQVLPQHPVRIFVAGDADYFRGRAAYHLYPHSVFFDPRSKELSWADNLKSGDWLFIFHQPEIQYDLARHELHWPTGRTTDVELKLVGPEGVLFRVR